MNLKNDDFSFNTSFSKKIDNLQTILQFYNADPIKAVQELNKIYNDYQQSITSKNKNNANDGNDVYFFTDKNGIVLYVGEKLKANKNESIEIKGKTYEID